MLSRSWVRILLLTRNESKKFQEHQFFLKILVGGFSLPSPLGYEALTGPGSANSVVKRDPNIKVNLENDDLWTQFHQIGTEMIITKLGRLVSKLFCTILSRRRFKFRLQL